QPRPVQIALFQVAQSCPAQVRSFQTAAAGSVDRSAFQTGSVQPGINQLIKGCANRFCPPEIGPIQPGASKVDAVEFVPTKIAPLIITQPRHPPFRLAKLLPAIQPRLSGAEHGQGLVPTGHEQSAEFDFAEDAGWSLLVLDQDVGS